MNAAAPNVLIVDDEIGPRESLRMILKPNYNIYTADNGHKALEMIQQIKMDVVTLDLKMPEISGIDTLKEIRQVDPEVMVIVITGFGTLRTAIEAIGTAFLIIFPSFQCANHCYHRQIGQRKN
jgi:DNA-binding NtrC family response regulator